MHDPDREDELHLEKRRQDAATTQQARQVAERRLRRLEDAMDKLSRQILEVVNRPAALDATAIHSHMVEAVAAVMGAARTVGACLDQVAAAREDDPVWRRAVRVFEETARGDNETALDLLRRMPPAAACLPDVANALYQQVDPIVQARRNTQALMTLMAADDDAAEKKDDRAAAVVQTEATPAIAPGSNASLALVRIFTNGIADERIEKASRLLADNKLTANEKLTKIDALIPFPATVSAERLGEMLGVTKQAVLKTAWWMQNRKGEKENEVGRRREGHRKRANRYEATTQDDD